MGARNPAVRRLRATDFPGAADKNGREYRCTGPWRVMVWMRGAQLLVCCEEQTKKATPGWASRECLPGGVNLNQAARLGLASPIRSIRPGASAGHSPRIGSHAGSGWPD